MTLSPNLKNAGDHNPLQLNSSQLTQYPVPIDEKRIHSKEEIPKPEKSTETSNNQLFHPASKPTDNNDTTPSHNENGGHQSQPKISLKFKPTVSKNWIHARRKKQVVPTSSAYPEIPPTLKEFEKPLAQSDKKQVTPKNSGFFPKSTKRISLAPASLLPKRFSTSNQQSSVSPNSSLLLDKATISLAVPPTIQSSMESSTATSRSTSTSSSTSSNNKKVSSKNPSLSNKSSNSGSLNAQHLSPNKQQSTANTPIVITPSSPTYVATYRQVLNRNTSFSSSTPSEKSALGKSINAFKKTTKSILFLDSSSNIGSTSNNNNLDFLTFPSDRDDMFAIRRSKSYTDADRNEALSFAFDSSEVTKRHVLTENGSIDYLHENENENGKEVESRREVAIELPKISYETVRNSDEISNAYSTAESSPNKISSPTGKRRGTTNRQRSKTIDASDNPLLELSNASSSNSGLLSSITNFVKINRNSSTSPALNKVYQNTESTLKLDNLEVVENETPPQFLLRLLNIYPITFICEILSSEDSEWLKETMQEYLKLYDFTNEPLDIALRKFLMLNYLPKETQQIDRCIYQFAKYYHSQHPELGFDQDTVYILTYSLIMVHTDRFNPNNKKKMTRFEFVQNVVNALESNIPSSDSNELTTMIMKELLGYFFDNITFCPLIKISPEQSGFALEALKLQSVYFPYPNLSFLNSPNIKTSDYEYRKSSVSSSTISIPSASPSINRSASQQFLSPQPPLRRKSSSFLWSTPALLDPYAYIVKNDKDSMNELKLLTNAKDINLSCLNPFILPNTRCMENAPTKDIPSIEMINQQLEDYVNKLDEDLNSEFLTKVWHTLTKKRIPFILKTTKEKSSYLVSEKTDLIPLNESEGEEVYLTRVIKVGMLDRQEVSSSHRESIPTPIVKPDITDLSTMDDNNNISTNKTQTGNKNKSTVWKRYFCILTHIGMFFFKDVSSFRMRFCGIDESDGTKMVIIEEATKSADTSSGGTPTVHSSITTPNTTIDSSTFITFPHFRSERTTDKYEKSEQDKFQSMIPTFILGNKSFATRKLQNFDYDGIVNATSSLSSSASLLPTSASSAQNITSENSNSNTTSSPSRVSLYNQNTVKDSITEDPYSSSSTVVNESELYDKPSKIKMQTQKYTFFIYGEKSKSIYMVPSLTELKSWIYSINITSAILGVKIDFEPLDYSIVGDNANDDVKDSTKYYEVAPVCNTCKSSDDIGENSVDDLSDESEGEAKENDEQTRIRSNTTFLSRITPSISTFGFGISSGKSEGDKKSKFSGSDFSPDKISVGFSDQTPSTKDNDSDVLEYVTAVMKSASPSPNAQQENTEKNGNDNDAADDEEVGLIKDVTDIEKKISFELGMENEAKESGNITDSTNRVLSVTSSQSSSSVHLYLLEHLFGVKRLLLAMPLQKKTKEDLLSMAKILGIKLEWIWFEKCKFRTFSTISKKMMALNKNEDEENMDNISKEFK